MSEVMNSLNNDLRQILVRAHDFASDDRDAFLQPHHLLLALTACDTSVRDVLAARGITDSSVTAWLGDRRISTKRNSPTARQSLLAPETKLAMARAHHNAFGNPVSPDHLAFALVETPTGVLGQMATALAVYPELREQLEAATADHSPTAGSEPGDEGATTATSLLDRYGRNLTAAALAGDLDPIEGRELEMRLICEVLARKYKNNPVLVGEPGVGKTAIVDGLALAIAAGAVPARLQGMTVYVVDMGSLVAGSKYRGDFEARIEALVKEVAGRDDVILFIDEAHQLISAGSSEAGISASNLLKPSLARGELQVIAATTWADYRKTFELDAALARRFEPIPVEPPTHDQAVRILATVARGLSDYHNVTIAPDVIEASVSLSERYMTDRFLPDKAIGLLDGSAARVSLNVVDVTESTPLPEVTVADLCDVLSDWTGVPIRDADELERQRLLDLEKIIGQRVIAQEQAIKAVARSLRRSRAGMRDPSRPIGSFIFTGPTGVGKTETVKAIAAAVFGDESAIVRLDMSEMVERHTVSRLIGAPPGYVGYSEGGYLTEAVRKRPFTVVLLDEIEKAHPEVFDTLLQVLDDGRLTDGQGRTVDFRNTVIIMTTNLGTAIKDSAGVGFISAPSGEAAYIAARRDMVKALHKHFRPEFMNRLDDVIVFNTLDDGARRSIVALMIGEIRQRAADQGITLEVEEAAVQRLTVEGTDLKMGARPLRRTLQRRIEDPLSELILARAVLPGGQVTVKCDENDALELVVASGLGKLGT